MEGESILNLRVGTKLNKKIVVCRYTLLSKFILASY